jgi:NAD+ diphosphatase
MVFADAAGTPLMAGPSFIPNIFAGGEVDRAGLMRKDAEWLARHLEHPESRMVVIWRDKHLVNTGEAAAPAYLSVAEALALVGEGAAPTLLGLHQDRAVFCVDLSHMADAPEHPALASQGEFMDIRDVAALMGRDEVQMLAQARGLSYWHRRHRFCGACGAPTQIAEAGHVRICTNGDCGVHHFPRTDPAVIMLVVDGDRCLLGRRPGRENFMYSTLAGFVEPGESLEDAVAREVLEETNIRVSQVRYAHSQPWPFPANLMLGFYADAATTEITANPDELADAQWFTRDDVAQLMQLRDKSEMDKAGLKMHLPRPISIARRLIGDWLEGRAG